MVRTLNMIRRLLFSIRGAASNPIAAITLPADTDDWG
jgi:hypothetical protein